MPLRVVGFHRQYHILKKNIHNKYLIIVTVLILNIHGIFTQLYIII